MLAVGLVIWGIVYFVSYVKYKYGYNIFNALNLVMMIIMCFICIAVLWYGAVAVEEGWEFGPLNYVVCTIATLGLLVFMFIRNLKRTSLPVAAGALVMQAITSAVVLLIIVLALFMPRRKQLNC